MSAKYDNLLANLDSYSPQELRRLLAEELTKKKLGLNWERNAIEHDAALNADIVLPQLNRTVSHALDAPEAAANLIIEGDNFDALRLLRATHRGRIRVIYIDPPYNTGNKDWVYNDHYVGANDRYRHSQWLEFLYQRLTLARDLLTPDGVLLVSINDENRSRLELLLEEVMPGRRLGSLTWRTRQGSNDTKQGFLSVDHEHILVFGNEGFAFKGFEKSYEMYSNTDNDPRGDWRISDLTCPKDFKERPNLYYPITDPKTDIAYPANPDRVWVYASKYRLGEAQQVEAKTMEEFIELRQILFPKADQRVETWHSMDALLDAIDRGDVPKSGKTPLLRRDLPDLDFWVGRKVGFGRPQFKRYKADLRNQNQPLSSWIVPSFEEDEYEADNSFVSATNQEGARVVAEIFGDRAFNYAKPFSLLKNLLQQATRPGDIVLDFFAGSGTTGHAVLALNAEDGGNRRFILCSSTEATAKEADKNLCRDVCAERIRRVQAGYGKVAGLGGGFAYLTLDKFAAADADFEAASGHAAQLLSLRHRHAANVCPADATVIPLAFDGELAVLLLAKVTEESLAQLADWPARRLMVYSRRPDTVRDYLAKLGRDIHSDSLPDALMRGQHTPT